MKNKTLILITVLSSGLLFFSQCSSKKSVDLQVNLAEKRVDVNIDGKLFTSYIYPDNIKKPVLWPVISSAGNRLTRSYPMIKKEGESVDHRHHIGVWLNYGDVNGLDFWNNAETTPPEKKERFGTIYHRSIEKAESGKRKLQKCGRSGRERGLGHPLSLDETGK